MKFIFKYLFFTFCAYIIPAYGAMEMGGTYNSIDSYTFMDMLITETGTLNGIRSEFFSVIVKGKANLERCIMREEVASYGIIEATATEFLKDITIYSGKTNLRSCNLTNLYILDHDSENPIQVILDGDTVINGSIIFETGDAKVYKSPNLVILGEVKGGTLIDLNN